jgi:uncharacterized protein (DUF885 family)
MRAWPFVFLLLAFGISGKALPQQEGSKALHDLFAAAWDRDMQDRPEEASEMGDRRWNDLWTDLSLEAYAQCDRHNQEVLARLAKIDRRTLNKTDQLNYDLFQKRYQDRVEQYKFHWFLMSFNQREGPQTSDELGDSLRFDTPKDYSDWLTRMRSFPAHLDQEIALLRQGIRESAILRRAAFISLFSISPARSARKIRSGSSKQPAKPWSSRLCRPLLNSSSSL